MNLAEEDIEDDFQEEDTSLLDLDSSERSFYAILNVPEDADDAQITQSFKSVRLSLAIQHSSQAHVYASCQESSTQTRMQKTSGRLPIRTFELYIRRMKC